MTAIQNALHYVVSQAKGPSDFTEAGYRRSIPVWTIAAGKPNRSIDSSATSNCAVFVKVMAPLCSVKQVLWLLPSLYTRRRLKTLRDSCSSVKQLSSQTIAVALKQCGCHTHGNQQG